MITIGFPGSTVRISCWHYKSRLDMSVFQITASKLITTDLPKLRKNVYHIVHVSIYFWKWITHFFEFSCAHFTAQKMSFSIKDSFIKCEQIRRKLWICSYLLKKSSVSNSIFCTVFNLIKFCWWKTCIWRLVLATSLFIP